MAHEPMSPQAPKLTPELLLQAYMAGVFPMAEGRDDAEVFWVDPKRRGILPLDGFYTSRSLRRTILKEPFEVRLNANFAGTVAGCAERDETWINDQIYLAYLDLHRMGYAHSQEVWEGDELVGGVYGVAIGGAFFGESMFSRSRDASKIALAYLVARLRAGGFTLFDTQFVTDHLVSLGAIEIPRADYRRRLRDALSVEANVFRQRSPVLARHICT